MFVKNHEVARLAEPEKKRGRKWLVVFWAAIFWISTLFVIGHPFLFGLQYTIYILPVSYTNLTLPTKLEV